jgi:acetyl esterase/lipase
MNPNARSSPRWRSYAFYAAAIALGCSACTQLGLWTLNAFATFSDYSRHSDISYGSEPARRLDLYLPREAKSAPVVVFFYGGGWNSGDKASYRFVGAAFAAAGVIAVLPNYTLYPRARFPTFMRDAASAVAWAHAHAREWGGDPDRLFVVGHSAGAHIAVLLALDPEYLQQVGGSTQWLRGVVGLAGPYDFLPFTDAYLNDLFGPPERFALSQPINFVRPDAPPILLMHGLEDRRVSPNNTRSLSSALQERGANISTRYFEHADHAALVAAFSIPERSRLPVLPGILDFIARESPAAPRAAAH